MPAFLQSFIEAEEERSRRIEQLRKEVREYAEEEAGSSITEQILLFLADEMVERLSEIDYELRKKFESYITPLIKQKYLYRYTGTFDRIRQSYIRVRMKTPAGQRECEWKYKNEILFVPYHSEQTIVKSVETVRCRSNMVWNFKAAASEKMKRQIFTVLEYILEHYEVSQLREYKLTGLQFFYEFCIREQITDIHLMELKQETLFQSYLEQKVEKEQRRKRLRTIVETARKVIFVQADEIRWDAAVWYLDRFHIAKERRNQSDSIERISFQEVCFRIKYRQTHPATDINPDSIRYHGIISSQYPTDRQSITGVRIGHQRSTDRYRQAHSQIHLLFGKSLDKLTSIGFIHQRIFP